MSAEEIVDVVRHPIRYPVGSRFGRATFTGRVPATPMAIRQDEHLAPEVIDMAKKGNWIQGVVSEMKKGALHKQMGVAVGKKIPPARLQAAAKKPGKLGVRARLALNMQKRRGKKRAKK